MDLDTLKLDYQNMEDETLKSADSLNRMKDSKNHPVLKNIKRQLIIESVLWTFVLVVFYDFFDGHLKSMFWNVLLATSIILLLAHNVLGFILVKNPINGDNLKESLKHYLRKIKTYALISTISRVLMITVFMLYLTSNVKDWSISKLYSSIVFFIVLIFIQIYALKRTWRKRVNRIEKQVNAFI